MFQSQQGVDLDHQMSDKKSLENNDETLNKDPKQLYLELFRARQRDMLVFSCLIFIFCSPIAIASIIFSIQAIKFMKVNNLERAAFLYNRSHNVNVFAMIFGGICWWIWLIFSIYLLSISKF